VGNLLEIPDKGFFPCPLCGERLEVRQSKKQKPYVVCDRCGVQLFVRSQSGVRLLERLVAEAEARNLWERQAALEKDYYKKCSKCGKGFWVAEKLIETSFFDGSFIGYRCPNKECNAIIPPTEER